MYCGVDPLWVNNSTTDKKDTNFCDNCIAFPAVASQARQQLH